MPGAPDRDFALPESGNWQNGEFLQRPESGRSSGRNVLVIPRITVFIPCFETMQKRDPVNPDRFLIAIMVANAIGKSRIDFCTKVRS